MALLQRAGGWAGGAAGGPVAQAPAYGAALVAAVRTSDTQGIAAIQVPAEYWIWHWIWYWIWTQIEMMHTCLCSAPRPWPLRELQRHLVHACATRAAAVRCLNVMSPHAL